MYVLDTSKSTIIYQQCGCYWHGSCMRCKTSSNVNHEIHGDLLLVSEHSREKLVITIYSTFGSVTQWNENKKIHLFETLFEIFYIVEIQTTSRIGNHLIIYFKTMVRSKCLS